MAAIHITEADLVRDARAILQQACNGAEIVIEEELRPLAIITPAAFPSDLEEILNSHRDPLRSSWD